MVYMLGVGRSRRLMTVFNNTTQNNFVFVVKIPWKDGTDAR